MQKPVQFRLNLQQTSLYTTRQKARMAEIAADRHKAMKGWGAASVIQEGLSAIDMNNRER